MLDSASSITSTSHTAPSVESGAHEPDPEPDSRVEILDSDRLLSDAQRRWLETTAAQALTATGAAGEVRARIVADEAMAAAHLKYSNIPGTTDVLTFDLRDDDSDALDVDLWVCVDEARRQAADRGHTVERELLLYILHGILHCLGYDDHSEEDHRAMHAEEDRILTAIGVGITYGSTAEGAE